APLRQAGGLRKHLRHHRARLHALHQERSEIAVQRTDVIVPAQTEAGADDDGFLADAGVDAASDLALADEDAEPLVEGANQLQPVKHVEQLIGGKLELGALDRGHRRVYRITNDVGGTIAGSTSDEGETRLAEIAP